MKQRLEKASLWILQVILTALASAGVALLQHYIETHGVNAGPAIDPANTAAIGSVISGAHVSIKAMRSVKI